MLLEYADKGTLENEITLKGKKNTPFTNDEIWRFLAQILIGLSEIHNKSIVHRDLKPLNIFKVGDF